MRSFILSWLSVASVLVSSPSVLSHSAVEAAPRTEQSWKERHALLTQRATEAGEKAQVLFIGDSITQGWEGAGKEVWEKFYARRNAVNLGIGGDRTQHVLWRLTNGNLKGLKPKAVVLMIGTNNSNGEDNTVEQIAEGIEAIVKTLREQLPDATILLLGIFPRNENPSTQRGKILQVNQIVQRLADGNQVLYIDFGYKFMDAHGTLPRTLLPDFLHLSPEGYQVWAEAIEPTLAKILGDLPVTASGASLSLMGEWTWTIKGPDGNPVSAPLILKQEGEKVTGRFARGNDRWLEIENGKAIGSEFSWTVTRDRPDGGSMKYRMSGKIEGDKITGTAKTEMDGSEVTSDWSAVRK